MVHQVTLLRGATEQGPTYPTPYRHTLHRCKNAIPFLNVPWDTVLHVPCRALTPSAPLTLPHRALELDSGYRPSPAPAPRYRPSPPARYRGRAYAPRFDLRAIEA